MPPACPGKPVATSQSSGLGLGADRNPHVGGNAVAHAADLFFDVSRKGAGELAGSADRQFARQLAALFPDVGRKGEFDLSLRVADDPLVLARGVERAAVDPVFDAKFAQSTLPDGVPKRDRIARRGGLAGCRRETALRRRR
jgi:hypothetical protein